MCFLHKYGRIVVLFGAMFSSGYWSKLMKKNNLVNTFFASAVQNERDRISCRREAQGVGTLTISILLKAEESTHQVGIITTKKRINDKAVEVIQGKIRIFCTISEQSRH